MDNEPTDALVLYLEWVIAEQQKAIDQLRFVMRQAAAELTLDAVPKPYAIEIGVSAAIARAQRHLSETARMYEPGGEWHHRLRRPDTGIAP